MAVVYNVGKGQHVGSAMVSIGSLKQFSLLSISLSYYNTAMSC
jgi:hypothetical protein